MSEVGKDVEALRWSEAVTREQRKGLAEIAENEALGPSHALADERAQPDHGFLPDLDVAGPSDAVAAAAEEPR